MEFKVKLRYLRISPRKVRLVAKMVKGKTAKEAQAVLDFTVKRAANPILKLLNSAIATAKNDFHKSEDSLYIKNITVDEGPSLKRILPRARGRADIIKKRTSHITLVLAERGMKEEKGKEKARSVEKKVEETKGEKENKEKSEIKKEERPKKKLIYKIGKGPSVKKEEIRPKRFFRRKAF